MNFEMQIFSCGRREGSGYNKIIAVCDEKMEERKKKQDEEKSIKLSCSAVCAVYDSDLSTSGSGGS